MRPPRIFLLLGDTALTLDMKLISET